jgi:hypothetical protein
MQPDMQCYICSETGNLVRSCVNVECTGFAHVDCIKTRYITNKKCGCCDSDIAVHTKTEFNICGCITSYIAKLYIFALVLLGIPSIFFLVVGKTLVTIGYDNPTNSIVIAAENGFFIVYAFFAALFYLSTIVTFFIHFCCIGSFKDYDIFTTLHLFYIIGLQIIIYISIIMIHGIGYPIIKYGFGFDEFLTCKTFTAGVVILLMVLFALLFGYCVYIFFKRNHELILTNFLQTEQDFGVVIEENVETDKLTE